MPSEQFFNYTMTRTSCFLMTWWWCLFCTLRPKSLVELLTFRKHLSSPLVFGGVCVSHLFSFLCCHFTLFVFVLCLVYPILPVTLHCPFLIAPSGFSNVFFIVLAHWNNSPHVAPFQNILSQQVNYSLFLLLDAACLAEKHLIMQIYILWFDQSEIKPTIYSTWRELIITSQNKTKNQ
jgi:hypothetical protein